MARDTGPLPFAPERSAATAATAHLPEGPPSRAWRLLDRFVLAGVLLGLIVPGAILAIGVRARPIENRPLVPMPSLTVDGALDATFFQGVDAFLIDHLAVRRYAIRVRGEAYYRTGGTGTPEVIRGVDGWLFPRNAFEPNCEHSVAEIDAAVDGVAAALAARGITFRFVALPDKHSIYPEMVGANPFPPACTDLQRPELRASLADLGDAAVDGWTILEAAKAAGPTEPLYYRGDTHWAPNGALQVIRVLITSIDPGVWDESEVVRDGTRTREIDLAGLMGIRRVERTPDIRLRPGIKPVRADLVVPVELRNARTIFTTSVTTDQPIIGGRTLILYDSYFGIDVHLIAPFFEHATWVHFNDQLHNPALATALGPFDTVIVQRVERFLYGSDLAAMFSDMAR